MSPGCHRAAVRSGQPGTRDHRHVQALQHPLAALGQLVEGPVIERGRGGAVQPGRRQVRRTPVSLGWKVGGERLVRPRPTTPGKRCSKDSRRSGARSA